jgi:hypothetical protein
MIQWVKRMGFSTGDIRPSHSLRSGLVYQVVNMLCHALWFHKPKITGADEPGGVAPQLSSFTRPEKQRGRLQPSVFHRRCSVAPGTDSPQ